MSRLRVILRCAARCVAASGSAQDDIRTSRYVKPRTGLPLARPAEIDLRFP